jgi:hypothetical protein
VRVRLGPNNRGVRAATQAALAAVLATTRAHDGEDCAATAPSAADVGIPQAPPQRPVLFADVGLRRAPSSTIHSTSSQTTLTLASPSPKPRSAVAASPAPVAATLAPRNISITNSSIKSGKREAESPVGFPAEEVSEWDRHAWDDADDDDDKDVAANGTAAPSAPRSRKEDDDGAWAPISAPTPPRASAAPLTHPPPQPQAPQQPPLSGRAVAGPKDKDKLHTQETAKSPAAAPAGDAAAAADDVDYFAMVETLPAAAATPAPAAAAVPKAVRRGRGLARGRGLGARTVAVPAAATAAPPARTLAAADDADDAGAAWADLDLAV